ncbi:DUF4012 domain-containing protein [Arthrobacter sp. D2-10]
MGLSALLLLVALSAAWLAFRAQQIQSSLEATLGLLPQLQSELIAGDGDAAQDTLSKLQKHTALARSAGTDPMWKAAGILPFVGSNFAAVTEVSVSADDVVNRAVAPLLDHFDSLDWSSLTPANGRIDVAPLRKISPSISAAATTVDLSYDRLASIDSTRLLPQVATPLTQITDSLNEARLALNAASSAAELIPAMLGADGQRNYLILIQNSAEVRATGGIPGALAVVTAKNGEIVLSAQGSATTLGRFSPPIPVSSVQEQIYSKRLGTFMQSVNLTPDFPTVAQTAKAMWEDRNLDANIDGVIAVDPIVLANILSATGPVELADSENAAVMEQLSQTSLPEALTAENVVPTLLSDVYAEIEEPSAQDEYFAAVAGEVFDAVASGAGESDQLIDALMKSSDENRIYLWSNASNEQGIINGTPLAGAVTGSAAGGATFGAYFNDGTGAKMDYHVQRTVQLNRSCTSDGYLQYTLTATITNNAPADAAESLPDYVTGGGTFGVPPGTVQTNLVGYGPNQSQLQKARMNGETVPLGSYRHDDRPVGVLTATLAPGEIATLELDFTNVIQQNEPVLEVTPTIQPLSEVVLPLQGRGECE